MSGCPVARHCANWHLRWRRPYGLARQTGAGRRCPPSAQASVALPMQLALPARFCGPSQDLHTSDEALSLEAVGQHQSKVVRTTSVVVLYAHESQSKLVARKRVRRRQLLEIREGCARRFLEHLCHLLHVQRDRRAIAGLDGEVLQRLVEAVGAGTGRGRCGGQPLARLALHDGLRELFHHVLQALLLLLALLRRQRSDSRA
mmetsp:Transcript_61949/g.178324  ORF Transcript_61949/g.178324 Transcript_61949/m.178324 type:complete len:202 (-) Transcript_61949:271-876(-)